MSDVRALIGGYIAMWNETDPAARAALAERVWEPAGTYVDPLVVATGRAAIETTVGAVQEQFAGLTFRLADGIDAHHNVVRFSWHLGSAAEPDMAVGFDVAVLSEGGRFQAVHGFLDRVPPGLA